MELEYLSTGEQKPQTTILLAGDVICRIVKIGVKCAVVDTEVEIHVNYAQFDPEFKFCRFGTIVVPAGVSEDKTLICVAPKGKTLNFR
jgi:hypothetical protein